MRQVNSMLHQKINQVFTEVLEFPFTYLATITKVDCTPDLQQANVHISILPATEKKNAMRYIIRSRKLIRKELGRIIKLRRTPELRYIYDDTSERVDEIDRLIYNNKQQEQ